MHYNDFGAQILYQIHTKSERIKPSQKHGSLHIAAISADNAHPRAKGGRRRKGDCPGNFAGGRSSVRHELSQCCLCDLPFSQPRNVMPLLLQDLVPERRIVRIVVSVINSNLRRPCVFPADMAYLVARQPDLCLYLIAFRPELLLVRWCQPLCCLLVIAPAQRRIEILCRCAQVLPAIRVIVHCRTPGRSRKQHAEQADSAAEQYFPHHQSHGSNLFPDSEAQFEAGNHFPAICPQRAVTTHNHAFDNTIPVHNLLAKDRSAPAWSHIPFPLQRFASGCRVC